MNHSNLPGPESFEESLTDEWKDRDVTVLQIVEYGDSELIDSFVAPDIPIPGEGEIIVAGWEDITNGESETENSPPMLVKDRVFQYYNVTDHDKKTEGVITLVTLAVVWLEE